MGFLPFTTAQDFLDGQAGEMPDKRKRDDRQNGHRADQGTQKTAKTARGAVPGEVRRITCPVCGRTAGRVPASKGERKYYETAETVSSWDILDDPGPETEYGIIQAQGLGRGRDFEVIGHFGPDDDPDGYFPAVKHRLMVAMAEWLRRGWITAGDIQQLTARPGARR